MPLKVKWDSKEYSPTKVGRQTLTGELVLPENVTNTKDIKPMFFVTVLEEELPEPSVESIKVSPLTKTVEEGETFKITATTSPTGVPAEVVWSLDKEGVVELSATGKTATVTALKEGTVNVIAQVKDNKELTSQSKVTVTAKEEPTQTFTVDGNLGINSVDEIQFTGEQPDLSSLTLQGGKFNLTTVKNGEGVPGFLLKAPSSKTLLATPIMSAKAKGKESGKEVVYYADSSEEPGIHFVEDIKNLTLNVSTGFSEDDVVYSLRHNDTYHRIDGVMKDGDMKLTLETKLSSEESPKTVVSSNSSRVTSKVKVPEMVDGELQDELTVKLKVEYVGDYPESEYNPEFTGEIEAKVHKKDGQFVTKVTSKK